MLKLSSKKGQHFPDYASIDKIRKEKVCIIRYFRSGKGLGLQEKPAEEIMSGQRSHCQTHKRQSICLQQSDNGFDGKAAGVYGIFSHTDTGEQAESPDGWRNVRLSDRRASQNSPPRDNECLQAIQKFSHEIQPYSRHSVQRHRLPVAGKIREMAERQEYQGHDCEHPVPYSPKCVQPCPVNETDKAGHLSVQ